MSIDTAAGKLRRALSHMEKDQPPAVVEKDEVLKEFTPIFQHDEIGNLSGEQFLRFLPYRNNRHWTGLARQGPRMTEDMDLLRKGVAILVDEKRDLAERVTEAKETVVGMGKGTLTAILLVAYPEKYGVWNNKSEAALKQIDVWPGFNRGESFGSRYQKVNHTLCQLSAEVGIDLWTLDCLLDYVVKAGENDTAQIEEQTETRAGEFVAEKHLQEFLVRNWDTTKLSQEWEIYNDADDPEAGVEFPTGVGPADLLLSHKTDHRLCVVELKRSQSRDKAVGQILRYIGWVRNHLDEIEGTSQETKVEGLLIVSKNSDHLRYALSATPDVRLQRYKVDFELEDVS